MSKKVLVAYASVSGSTGEVAEAIGDVLHGDEVSVDVLNVDDVDDISLYSAVVVGSSIRAGRWLPQAFDFLEDFQDALSRVPVALFTTCLAIVQDTSENRQLVLAYMEPVRQTIPHVRPVGLGLFAGSLDPQRIALPTLREDLAPQGDYRDWEAIRAWAVKVRPTLLEEAGAPTEPIILRDAVLSYTDMSGADLDQADLRGAELHQANLSEANLQGADLVQTDLRRADLTEADLSEAGLNWAELNWADMSGANLARANLIGADIKRANLDHANLSGAILNGANLQQANLQAADLSHADLNWADLRGANLSEANLSKANLGWANFSGANLSRANLTGALYNRTTQWPEGFSPQERGCLLVGRVE